jgi:chromatin assembly factor 1 subunit A
MLVVHEKGVAMARQTRGDRAEQEGEEEANVIPAPGVPGMQSTVSQPQTNYPEPGTGPKQPGFNLSHEQMIGESNEDFEDRALEQEEEVRAQTEQEREERAKQDEERAQASQQEMEQRDQEREQRRQERRQEREARQEERAEERAASEG